MKSINLVRIACCLFLLVMGNKITLVIVFAILTKSYKNKKECFLLLILCVRLLIPIQDPFKNGIEGKVIKITEKTVFIENRGVRAQIITDEPLILDDRIIVVGEEIVEEDSSHFYSFNFDKYRQENRIIKSIIAQSIEVIRPSTSVRGFLQRAIMRESSDTKELMMNLLLNQNITSTSTIFDSCGFHYGWIITIFSSILHLFYKEKTVHYIKLMIIVLFSFILGFPFALFRLFYFELLKGKLNNKQLIAIFTILVYLFHPALLSSLAFLIPMGLRCIPQKLENRTLFLTAIQSTMFYTCSWIQLLFFQLIQAYAGFMTLILALQLAFPMINLAWISKVNTRLSEVLNNGNWIGEGRIPTFLLLVILVLEFKSSKRKNIVLTQAILCILLQFGWVSPFGEVSMINVGQGDSLLIRLPWNQGNLLIDTGKSSDYSHLESFLRAKGIRRLDVLLITHQDEDHNGNKEALLENFDVVQVIENYQEEILLKTLHIKVLSPLKHYVEENENSLVCAFEINGLRFLMMGDATSAIEQELVEHWGCQDFDILKLGHHGSKTSTSKLFLENYHFQLGLISSGVNNRYGHPSEEVMLRCQQYGLKTLNTQDVGDITITFTHFFNFINTSNHEFGIINEVIK